MVSSITDMINNIAVYMYMQYLFYVVTASIPRKEEVSYIMYIMFV